MGRGGQLGGVAVHAQRQIRGANDGDTTAPRGTQMDLSYFFSRWRSFSLIFVGDCGVHATGHLPVENVETFFDKGLEKYSQSGRPLQTKITFRKKKVSTFSVGKCPGARTPQDGLSLGTIPVNK